MILCPTFLLLSSSPFNIKYYSVVRWPHMSWFWWSSMTVCSSASKVWNFSWMGIVMQYAGCVLACLQHSSLMMCSARELRCFNGRAEEENHFWVICICQLNHTPLCSRYTTTWHLLSWQYILTNAIALVYFVPYFHYLCSVTHTICIPSKSYGRKSKMLSWHQPRGNVKHLC